MAKTQPKIERTKDGLLLPVSARFRLITTGHLRRRSARAHPTRQAITLCGKRPPVPRGRGRRAALSFDISLLGYGRNWESQEAVDYVVTRNLPAASFRQVLAIGESTPGPRRPRQGLSGGRFAPEVRARRVRALAVSVVRRGRARAVPAGSTTGGATSIGSRF